MIVTKDHWSDESYSGDSEPEVDAKPAKSQKSSGTSKPALKGRESTASLGSGKEDKKPASSSFGGGGGGGGGNRGSKAGGAGGKAATGQSTLKGFFTKK